MNSFDVWYEVLTKKHTVIAEVTIHGETMPQIITPYLIEEDGYVSYYWGLGPSRCGGKLSTIKILKDFGPEPDGIEGDRWWKNLNKEYLLTYYPTTRYDKAVPDKNETFLGWISPEGEYIISAFGNHDSTARVIYLEETGKLKYGTEARELLTEELGWVMVHGHFIIGRTETQDLTEAQYKVAKDLVEKGVVFEYSVEGREIVPNPT